MRKSRPQTNETREKIRKSLTKHHPPFTKKCPRCNDVMNYKTYPHLKNSIRKNQMCRNCKIKFDAETNHYSLMGRNSSKIQSETRRSKNEIHFAELCKNVFSNVDTNKQIFNGWDADVILNDQKVAVLWNGKWHYEKITQKHSVSQVQNRDKIKLNEIKKCGYTPYIIRDDGKEDELFVKSEFDKFQSFLKRA